MTWLGLQPAMSGAHVPRGRPAWLRNSMHFDPMSDERAPYAFAILGIAALILLHRYDDG